MVHRAIKIEHHQSVHFDESGNKMTIRKRHVCEYCRPRLRNMREANFEVQRQLVLTKGDNNAVHDVGIYPDGREWVHREEVVGLVKCSIPMIGGINLFMKDHLEASYVVLTATLVIGILL